ncbi:MAG TPA: signal peptidase II [Solirubrobacteraceae bacterium]|nr:signal peptidase II [Solirubrobacteraceae bacterium]
MARSLVPRAIGRATLLTAAVVAADQLTKAYVRGHVDQGTSDGIFPAVDLVYVRNKGVAFGQLSGSGLAVTIVIAVALLALLAYFATHLDRPGVWVPTGLLLGGSIGNIVDRARDGAVTDFLKLPHWPAFNLADVAITLGVLSLLYVVERAGNRDGADGPS